MLTMKVRRTMTMEDLQKVCIENGLCTRMKSKEYGGMLYDVDTCQDLTDNNLLELATFIYEHSNHDWVENNQDCIRYTAFILTILSAECKCWLDM